MKKHCPSQPFKIAEYAGDVKTFDDDLGKFSDYLSREVKTLTRYNPHKQYVSSIHHYYVTNLFPERAFVMMPLHKILQERIYAEYAGKARGLDEPLQKSAQLPTSKEFDYIAYLLMTRRQFETLALLTWDLQGIGRIVEVTKKCLNTLDLHR